MDLNIGDLMGQLKGLQSGVEEAQKKIRELEVTGAAGGDLVQITMNGKHEVRKVRIDQSLLGDDKDMLEDLVAAAANDAVRRVDQAVQEKMSSLAGGMPLPPGFKFPT